MEIAPDKVGLDLGKVLGIEALGVAVSEDLNPALFQNPADATIHSTASSLKEVFSQLSELIQAGNGCE